MVGTLSDVGVLSREAFDAIEFDAALTGDHRAAAQQMTLLADTGTQTPAMPRAEAYTRAGDLQVTALGAVITSTGFPVLSESGPLTVPPSTQVTIGTDGTVSVVPLGLSAAAQSQVDRIKLVNPSTKDLQKGSDGLLRLKSGAKAKTDETVTITSGELESSNVNAAQSLVNMIELQRLYELQIKSISSTDQNEQSAQRMMMAA